MALLLEMNQQHYCCLEMLATLQNFFPEVCCE
jgi:hypothetical protein